MPPRHVGTDRAMGGDLELHSATELGFVEPQLNPVRLYFASMAAGSRPTMVSSLRKLRDKFFPGQVVEQVAWHRLDHGHLVHIRQWLAERYAPTTANRALSALRGILKQAYRAELINSEHYTRACQIERVRGKRLPAGRALVADELRAVFDACDCTTAMGARDAAVIALLYGCGIRSAELHGIDLADYDARGCSIRILRGKGFKERLVYPPRGTVRAIETWLTFRGRARGPLVCPMTRNRSVPHVGRPYSKSSIGDCVTRAAVRAGTAHFRPHDLRRTFVGDMLDAQVDLSTVQRLVGHESPATTAQYDRRPERAKALAAERLHVPFGGGDD
jgi:site-specific recombinase XerD